MDKFDKYYKDNFKGERDFWIGELERHLSSKTLESFKSLRNLSDSYDDIKRKLLLAWYKDEKELSKGRMRQKFKNARPKQGESLFLFTNRLEGLFKLGYPKHDSNKSGTLISQFQMAVSRTIREMIKTQIMSLKMKDQNVQWKQIRKWARLMDLEIEKEKELNLGNDDDANDTKEAVIHLGKEENKTSMLDMKVGEGPERVQQVHSQQFYSSRLHTSLIESHKNRGGDRVNKLIKITTGYIWWINQRVGSHFKTDWFSDAQG